MPKSNIILIGFRCSGKTTIGRIISKKLSMELLDSDDMIERRCGMSIGELVKRKGWHFFREIEKEVVAEISRKNSIVAATGGGTPLDGENVRMLKASGWLVWLKAHPSFIKQRMRQQLESGLIRPSLTGEDPVAEVAEVLAQRMPLYQQVADFIVKTDGITQTEVAQKIIAAYEMVFKAGH